MSTIQLAYLSCDRRRRKYALARAYRLSMYIVQIAQSIGHVTHHPRKIILLRGIRRSLFSLGFSRTLMRTLYHTRNGTICALPSSVALCAKGHLFRWPFGASARDGIRTRDLRRDRAAL